MDVESVEIFDMLHFEGRLLYGVFVAQVSSAILNCAMMKFTHKARR